MATVSITIQITRSDYPSLQVGDIAFYATPNDDVAGFKNADEGDITKIGEITAINNTTSLDDGTKTTTLTCNIDTVTTAPTTSDFIFFSKDNKVNLTSLLGYYASVKFKNNSTTKAEMFSSACEINESSK
tara:strand:- start:415 stop:804 length:390 start_codon:yes stop_codon:yes gene_type:complete